MEELRNTWRNGVWKTRLLESFVGHYYRKTLLTFQYRRLYISAVKFWVHLITSIYPRFSLLARSTLSAPGTNLAPDILEPLARAIRVRNLRHKDLKDLLYFLAAMIVSTELQFPTSPPFLWDIGAVPIPGMRNSCFRFRQNTSDFSPFPRFLFSK